MKQNEYAMVKAARIAAGKTQAELAKAVGVCTSTIGRYERGMNMRSKTYTPIDMYYQHMMSSSIDQGGREWLHKLAAVLDELKNTDHKWIRPKK
jgi:transcriptional regulator with XRE-family HTH domain